MTTYTNIETHLTKPSNRPNHGPYRIGWTANGDIVRIYGRHSYYKVEYGNSINNISKGIARKPVRFNIPSMWFERLSEVSDALANHVIAE
jgi:hypothetical protein